MLALAPFGACDQPVAPSRVLAGDWTGTITDSAAGNGALSLTITQTGPGISGAWASTFGDTSFNRSGSLSGTITGSPIVLFLTPTIPIACPTGSLTGTLSLSTTVQGNRLTGTYTVLTCSGVNTGSVAVERR